MISTIDINPQGNKRKVEGLCDEEVAISE
jgi:hypothetical protein